MTNNPLVEALRTLQQNFCRMNCPHGAEQNWPHDPACETLRQSVSALASSGNATGDDKGLVEELRRGIIPWITETGKFPVVDVSANQLMRRAADLLTALSSGNEVAGITLADAMDALVGVLEADPGPKAQAMFRHARELWTRYDRHLASDAARDTLAADAQAMGLYPSPDAAPLTGGGE